MSGEIIGCTDSVAKQFGESCAFEHALASLRPANDPPTEDAGIRGLPRKRLRPPAAVMIFAALMAFGSKRNAGKS